MNDGSRKVLLIGLGVGAVALALVVRNRRAVAIRTVEDIESQIAALDPATRASVIARLTRDSVAAVRNLAEQPPGD